MAFAEAGTGATVCHSQQTVRANTTVTAVMAGSPGNRVANGTTVHPQVTHR